MTPARPSSNRLFWKARAQSTCSSSPRSVGSSGASHRRPILRSVIEHSRSNAAGLSGMNHLWAGIQVEDPPTRSERLHVQEPERGRSPHERVEFALDRDANATVYLHTCLQSVQHAPSDEARRYSGGKACRTLER